MFLFVILSCIALASAQGTYPHTRPYRFGYATRDIHNLRYRDEAGNGVRAVAGIYGYIDGRGNALFNNYGVDAGCGIPVYGGYGLGYGGYGLGYRMYGLRNLGYSYGSILGLGVFLRAYWNIFY